MSGNDKLNKVVRAEHDRLQQRLLKAQPHLTPHSDVNDFFEMRIKQLEQERESKQLLLKNLCRDQQSVAESLKLIDKEIEKLTLAHSIILDQMAKTTSPTVQQAITTAVTSTYEQTSDKPMGILGKTWAEIKSMTGKAIAHEALTKIGCPMTLAQLGDIICDEHISAGNCTRKDKQILVNRISSHIWIPNYDPTYDYGPGRRGLAKAPIAPFIFQTEVTNRRSYPVKHYVLREWIIPDDDGQRLQRWEKLLNLGAWSGHPINMLDALDPDEVLMPQHSYISDVEHTGQRALAHIRAHAKAPA